jgi:hypothetical protein
MDSNSRLTRLDQTTRTIKLPDVVPVDIEGALNELGLDFTVRGDEATALCPAPDHFDSSPSWSMNLETGKHHCFSCGFGGSFQWLVQIVSGKRSAEALAWLKTRHVRIGIVIDEAPPPSVHEADLWNTVLPPQWALDERGVTAETCEAMEIRWLEENSSWIFPIRDPWTDRLIGWQEKGTGENRDFVDNWPRKVKKATTVFGYRNLKATGTEGPVVVVENPVKAGRFHSAGVPRVVATMGASFVDYQVNDLLWPVADEIIFGLDNDKAGHGRLVKYISQNPYGRESVKIFNYGNVQRINGAYVHFPDDRDPGDLTHEELRWGTENATPAVFTYFAGIDYAL